MSAGRRSARAPGLVPAIVRIVAREGTARAELIPAVAAAARALRAAAGAGARVWHGRNRVEEGAPGAALWVLAGREVTPAPVEAALAPAMARGAVLRVLAGGAAARDVAAREVAFYGGPRLFAIAAAGLAALSAAALDLEPAIAAGAVDRSDVEAAALLVDGAMRGLRLRPRERAVLLRRTVSYLARNLGQEVEALRPALDERAEAARPALAALVGRDAVPDLTLRAGGPAGRRPLARYRRAMARVGRALRPALRRDGPMSAPALDFYAFRFIHLAALHFELEAGVEVALDHALAMVIDPEPDVV